MTIARPFKRFGALPAAFAVLLANRPSLAQGAGDSSDVRLVVVIVVDQMRADYLTRYGRYFRLDGFRKLARDGASFESAYYSYGSTATAPGHSTLSTGRLPREHGIVGNKWFLSAAEGGRAAIFDPDTRLVGVDAQNPSGAPSPIHLIGPTIGDQFKLSDVRSRVFSVAMKDRAAVLTAGHRPDGAFWWDSGAGRFVTSRYYAPSLPAYVRAFNTGRNADRYVGQTWDRSLPGEAYAGCSAPLAEWLEDDGGLGKTFPHKLPETAGKAYGAALFASPFGNEMVFEIARRTVEYETLGADDSPDLLWVCLSSFDVCGHLFGPESPEMLDMTVRLDAQLADFLKGLDQTVSLRKCMIVITADHGITTPPPRARALGLGGGYFDVKKLPSQIDDALAKALGPAPEGSSRVLGVNMPWVYLTGEAGDRRPVESTVRAAADIIRAMPGVEAVYSDNELSGPPPSRDDRGRWLAWRCYHPATSGQIYVQLAPYWSPSDDHLAGHAAGNTHDRHVPLVMVGPGIRPGVYFEPADPLDIAPTIAACVGIEPPLNADGRALSEALDRKAEPRRENDNADKLKSPR